MTSDVLSGEAERRDNIVQFSFTAYNSQLWFSRLESWSRDVSRLVFKVLVFWLFLVIKLALGNEDEHL